MERCLGQEQRARGEDSRRCWERSALMVVSIYPLVRLMKATLRRRG